jgi:hypothetical protein
MQTGPAAQQPHRQHQPLLLLLLMLQGLSALQQQ